MIGVVNLDKPVGPTSHDMVALVRRLSGMRRIGHAGTLDPLASGVLPILVGGATRLSQELTGSPKRYDAVVRLGFRSRTDDAEGPLEPGGPPPTEELAVAALAEFVGSHPQRPPAFSARKVGGQPAHRSARRGITLELAPRTAVIHDIRLIETSSGDGWLDLHLDLTTGPGTYVRSLARDLGERLGSGGYLHQLRRTEAAGLRIADARVPADLESLAAGGRFAEALIPVDGLLNLPIVELDPRQADRFAHGGTVALPGDGRVAVRGPGGLLGIGSLAEGHLQPQTVLAEVGE